MSQEIATEARLSGDEAAFQAGLANARAEAFRSGGGEMAGVFGSLAARTARFARAGGSTSAAIGGEIASMSDVELAASASPYTAFLQMIGAITRAGGRMGGGGSGDPVVEELRGIRANTSPGPVFTGSSLQGPLQSAAQP